MAKDQVRPQIPYISLDNKPKFNREIPKFLQSDIILEKNDQIES